jgi:hypothetical protein
MLAMSVNDVPGWLVTIPPSGIGVPVAGVLGLVPHCEVLTAAALLDVLVPVPAGVLVPVPAVLLVPLLQPAAAMAMDAASRKVLRVPAFMYPPPGY